MSCEQHHGCDGVECQPPMDGDRLIGMLQAIRDRDTRGVPVHVEGEADTTPVPREPMASLVWGAR